MLEHLGADGAAVFDGRPLAAFYDEDDLLDAALACLVDQRPCTIGAA